MVRRIKDISELEGSGFGRPCPRHGLKLLFWFADCCICICNDDMFLQCDPARGDYGFHFFENRRNKHKVKLLPDLNFPYYVVGNMNYPGADTLPDYVVEDYTYCRDDNSNADRIIVSVHEGNRFGKVYVTTHNDLSNYDPRATFHITRTLLKIIKSYLHFDDFLRDTRYHPQHQVKISNQPVFPSPWRYYDSDCHIDIESASVSNSSADIENDAASQDSESLTKKKGLCERFCTIL